MIEFSIDCLVASLENVPTHIYKDKTSSVDFVIAINVVVSFFHIIQFFFFKWRSKPKLLGDNAKTDFRVCKSNS